MKLLMLASMPNLDNAIKGIFNKRAANSLGALVELEVFSLRTWRPGRPFLRKETLDNYKVWHFSIPHKPSTNPYLTWINYLVIKAFTKFYLRKSIKSFDMVHSVSGSYAALGSTLARSARAKHILQLTGSDVHSEFPKVKSAFHMSRAIKGIDLVVGNSKALVQTFNQIFGTTFKAISVYRGVDLSFFTAEPIKSSKPIFLFVGGLSAYEHYSHKMNTKGGLNLLDAWQRVEEKMHEAGAQLLFGGPDTSNDFLSERLRQFKYPNQIKVVGMVAPLDLRDLYQQSTAIILPSMEEGMPNVAVEAMASGRMVIASKVGGVPELIDHNENGRIFQAGNVEELANEILQAVQNPSLVAEQGKLARKKVENRFDAAKFGQAYFNLYQELCAE